MMLFLPMEEWDREARKALIDLEYQYRRDLEHLHRWYERERLVIWHRYFEEED